MHNAKAPTQRQLRVGEEIRHALAETLRSDDLRDPMLRDVSITVTEVRIGPDLRNATVFVMPLGGARAESPRIADIIAALNRAGPFLRGRVARAIHLKFAPNLHFKADTSFDEADKIGGLLRSVRGTGRDDLSGQDSQGDTDGEAP